MRRPNQASENTGSPEGERSFAHVYDALYARDPKFLRAQLDFLREIFGPPPSRLLDLGCGTGNHLIALSQAGYTLTGVDSDPLMLRRAKRKESSARLILGDLRRLPFGVGFHGALCLESPLAYLLDDISLLSALKGIHDALTAGAKLLIDVYDYVGGLGTRPIKPQESVFETDEMRVTVRESHRYEKNTRLWTMRQRFEVDEAGRTSLFQVTHRLRMRTMDEYAEALERVGFSALEAMTGYPTVNGRTLAGPHAPDALRDERRLILIARH